MLAQFYPPIVGGEERMVQVLSIELARRGHDVAVATLWHDDLPEYEVEHGVKVYRLRSTSQRLGRVFAEAGRRHAPPWPDPEAMIGLRRVVAQHQPEIVHAHNWIVHSFLPLKRCSGAKLVVTLHDYSLVCAKKRLIYQDQPCTGPMLLKCLACAASHYGPLKGVPVVIANNASTFWEHTAVDMFMPISQAVSTGNRIERSGVHFQVIPDFVPDYLSPCSDDMNPFLAALPPGEFILFAGDLSQDKGITVLLKAYAGLTSAPPLVVIGRPVSVMPHELPANVVHLGPWPHAAVMEAWRRCRIALVPSVWAEPFGLVALEAMAAGRPVIASATGGLLDIVVDGETGLLVPPGDLVALRDAMAHLLASPALAQQMGAAGQRRVAEFSASAVVPRVEQAYEAVLGPVEHKSAPLDTL